MPQKAVSPLGSLHLRFLLGFPLILAVGCNYGSSDHQPRRPRSVCRWRLRRRTRWQAQRLPLIATGSGSQKVFRRMVPEDAPALVNEGVPAGRQEALSRGHLVARHGACLTWPVPTHSRHPPREKFPEADV